MRSREICNSRGQRTYLYCATPRPIATRSGQRPIRSIATIIGGPCGGEAVSGDRSATLLPKMVATLVHIRACNPRSIQPRLEPHLLANWRLCMHISATRLERCWTVYDEDTVIRRRRVAAISVSQFAHGALFCRSLPAYSLLSRPYIVYIGRRTLHARSAVVAFARESGGWWASWRTSTEPIVVARPPSA